MLSISQSKMMAINGYGSSINIITVNSVCNFFFTMTITIALKWDAI